MVETKKAYVLPFTLVEIGMAVFRMGLCFLDRLQAPPAKSLGEVVLAQPNGKESGAVETRVTNQIAQDTD